MDGEGGSEGPLKADALEQLHSLERQITALKSEKGVLRGEIAAAACAAAEGSERSDGNAGTTTLPLPETAKGLVEEALLLGLASAYTKRLQVGGLRVQH